MGSFLLGSFWENSCCLFEEVQALPSGLVGVFGGPFLREVKSVEFLLEVFFFEIAFACSLMVAPFLRHPQVGHDR